MKEKFRVLVVCISYMGDETPSKFMSMKSRLGNINYWNITYFVVNNCDQDTRLFLKVTRYIVDRGLSSDIDSAISHSSILVQLVKYYRLLRDIKNRELSERDYLEYQEALEKTMHYMGLAIQSLGNPDTVASILKELEELNTDVLDAGDLDIIKKALPASGTARLIEASKLLSECFSSISDVLVRVVQYIENFEDGEVYVLVPHEVLEYFKRLLSNVEFLVY